MVGLPRSAAKHAPESKRGKQHQSIEPVAADERRGLQVADQRVVLDPRHGRDDTVPVGRTAR